MKREPIPARLDMCARHDLAVGNVDDGIDMSRPNRPCSGSHVRKKRLEGRRACRGRRRKGEKKGQGRNGEPHAVMFELLDSYLLENSPAKGAVVASLLASQPSGEHLRPFMEGIARLGDRTPDLALLALRLAAAHLRADDATVLALRDASQRARSGDTAARENYFKILRGDGTSSAP